MLELVQVSCIECRYLFMPNPDEDHYLCLRTLERIIHELDDVIVCGGYEKIPVVWKPCFIKELYSYM